MYAGIGQPENVAQVLNYHELKVKKGVAECLFCGNSMKDPDQLTRRDKLYHFQRMNVRNDRVKNTIHFSLNFHPSEKLSNPKMQVIAQEYMQKMGLGHQPFLVYRHYDTLHPHLHIVCSSIQKAGDKIELNRSEYYKSKKVTMELEKTHSLFLARRRKREDESLRLQPLLKVVYGKMPIKPAFDRVLTEIIDHYKFTSLAEFNVLLKFYNMEAYRGKESSYLYQHGGLYYRLLEGDKNKSRIALLSSSFDSKPTLKNLERKFALHLSDPLRLSCRQRITGAIDQTLNHNHMDLPSLISTLEKEGITTVLQRDKKGLEQNIFYIDQQNKSIFEGLSLGAPCTIAALRKRCLPEGSPVQVISSPAKELTLSQRILQKGETHQQELTLSQKILQKQPKIHRHGLRH